VVTWLPALWPALLLASLWPSGGRAELPAPLVATGGGAVGKVAAAFEPRFHEVLEREAIPGGAFVVVDRDRVIRLGTHGIAALGADDPVLADTVFRLASVSKTFAGELAVLLARQRRLNLQDPVRRHVPAFRLQQPQAPVTLDHLLSQRSGIVAHAWDNLIEEGRPLDEILPRFGELRPVCDPGTCYTYQNVAFSLVEDAIAHADNSSYAESLQRRILEPLGMRHASVGYAGLQAAPRRAQPHVKRRQAWTVGTVEEDYYHLLPAAGVNASILDVALWLQAQLGARPEVIDEAVVREVSTPRIDTPATLRRKHWREHLTGAWYGIGWRIYDFRGLRLVGHGGWVSGYRSEIAWSPDTGIGFAVLLNAEDASASELITGFWEQLVDQPELAALPAD
jgi:beta-lactamase class C